MKPCRVCLLWLQLLCAILFCGPLFCSEDSAIRGLSNEPQFSDFSLNGVWESGELGRSVDYNPAPTYFVHTRIEKKDNERLSCGGALNLKYYSGLSYEHLRKKLAGKTISVDVYMPGEFIGTESGMPNKIRMVVKSFRDGKWAEYYEGSEYTRVKYEGCYRFKIKMPERSVKTKDGYIFNPEDTVLVSIEYFPSESTNNFPYISFSFTNFTIEGVELNYEEMKWQLVRNGYTVKDEYLPYFASGSTIVNSVGNGMELAYYPEGEKAPSHKFSGTLKNVFLSLSVFVPKELCAQKGLLTLNLEKDGKVLASSENDFHACNLDGIIFLTMPLDGLDVKGRLEEILQTAKLTLRIKADIPHTTAMMPIAIEPVMIRVGRLIPFDKKWRYRNCALPGLEKEIAIPDDGTSGEGGVSASALGDSLYQMNAVVRLKGGVDWKSPYYRVEFIRELTKIPANLDNMHMDMSIDPITDTSALWQKPYRARIGVMDAEGRVMLGPNVSLSENIHTRVSLDISTANPIPKGFTMPGFDPKNVKAIIINLEGSHAPLAPRDINIHFSDLQ